MQPFYWSGTTNFGDYINQWLWPQLLDGYLGSDDGVRLVGIGSLLKSSLNIVQGKKVIFGTGSGYGAFPHPSNYQEWSFYFVRGPLTAQQFGLDKSKGIVDGAWLVGLLPEYNSSFNKKGVSFIPHWTSADSGNWRSICDRAGMNYICPLSDLKSVLKQIAESELVVTESLHGAIMADLFRTPWVPVSISPKFLPFKWVDWFQSVKVQGSVNALPLSDLFEYLYCRKSWRDVEYRNHQLSLDYAIEHEPADVQVEKPNYVYRQKLRAKKLARDGRRKLIQSAASIRNSFPFHSWNERHQERVADLLVALVKGPALLSADAVRSERLAQLEEVLDTLKTDYDSGLIVGPSRRADRTNIKTNAA